MGSRLRPKPGAFSGGAGPTRRIHLAAIRASPPVHAASSSCGTTASAASTGRPGYNQHISAVPATAPTTCAGRKGIASRGRMPANVSLNILAIVTAGLANDVDDVKKYAAAM